MKIKGFLLFVVLTFLSNIVFSQLSGNVKDVDGLPLEAASILIKGTTRNTFSNELGNYSIVLEPGKYTIVCRYIGYRINEQEINYKGGKLDLDFKMDYQQLAINEIEISDKRKDPAYEIIRNAIKKRSYYLARPNHFIADAYLKTIQKLVKTPKAFMGQDLGNLGGILDTNRQGIIYLSESSSKVFYQHPEKIREQILSSRVSGNSNGFTLNRANMLQWSLYNPSFQIGRNVISPISPDALLYYKYKFEGSYFDEDKREINKIQVIPRNSFDPLYSGYLYIVDDEWNIQSSDLYITGKNIGQEALDTLNLKQQYVFEKKTNEWLLFSQFIRFSAKIFGFEIEGNMSGNFMNYDLNTKFDPKAWKSEATVFAKDANKKSEMYWDSIRPTPLLKEELSDFTRKDSLQTIWKSKVYQDSMDRKSNKFTSNSLLLGYTYSNSFKNRSFSIKSPLQTVQFDPIRGYYFDLGLSYFQSATEENLKNFRISADLSYGISEKVIRPFLGFSRRFDKIFNRTLAVEAGIQARQIGLNNQILPLINTYYSLFSHKSFVQVFERRGGSMQYSQVISPVFDFQINLGYWNRYQLQNNTELSYFNKDKVYEPQISIFGLSNPNSNEVVQGRIKIDFLPGRKFTSYPNSRFYLESDYPKFTISSRATYYTGNIINGADKFSLRTNLDISDEMSLGYFGSLRWLMSGSIINGKNIPFIDNHHFLGNETIVYIGSSEQFSRYRIMPFYQYSTNTNFVEFHSEYNAQGLVLSKIPLLRNLKLEENVGFKYLSITDGTSYSELSVGISNIGWSVFRMFRVDFTWSYDYKSKESGNGITVGINLL